MTHALKKSPAFTVRLGARGRVVLPAAVRRQLDLEEGSRLILTVEEPGVLRLVSARRAADAAMGLLKDLAGDRSLADELIAERREEAQRD